MKHIYTIFFAITAISAFGQTNLVLNGTGDDFKKNTSTNTDETYSGDSFKNTDDNADAWDMTPNSTVVDNDGNTIDSPYKALWNNQVLDNWLRDTYNGGSNLDEQPGATKDGTYSGSTKTWGLKLYDDGSPVVSSSTRRLYQKIAVNAGSSYTFSMDSRSEAENIPSEVFMLNEEITTETGLENGAADSRVDHYLEITNDYNSSKGDADTNTFTTNSFTFTASTSTVVIYVRSLLALSSSTEVFYDNISLVDDQTASIDDNLKDSISIYPNPTNGAINIDSSDEIISLGVYDLAGKKVSILNDISNFIDVSHLNKGVYIMEFQLQKGQVTKKLVIE